MRTSIPVLFALGLFRLSARRFHFEKGELGERFTMEDGRRFRVFRRARRRKEEAGPAKAAFTVRFKPARMSIEQNIRFSRLPMILMLGFPGFRAKYWTVEDETGTCQGIYEWDSIDDANRYAASIAIRFIAGRSEPGSVSWKVIDQEGGRYWACAGPSASAPQTAAQGAPHEHFAQWGKYA